MLIDCINEARLNYSVVRNKKQNLIGHNKILLLTLNCSHWRKGVWEWECISLFWVLPSFKEAPSTSTQSV